MYGTSCFLSEIFCPDFSMRPYRVFNCLKDADTTYFSVPSGVKRGGQEVGPWKGGRV